MGCHGLRGVADWFSCRFATACRRLNRPGDSVLGVKAILPFGLSTFAPWRPEQLFTSSNRAGTKRPEIPGTLVVLPHRLGQRLMVAAGALCDRFEKAHNRVMSRLSLGRGIKYFDGRGQCLEQVLKLKDLKLGVVAFVAPGLRLVCRGMRWCPATRIPRVSVLQPASDHGWPKANLASSVRTAPSHASPSCPKSR